MINGSDLSPFFNMEYSTIDQAARKLGLEVGELLHLGAIGAIELSLRLKDVSGVLEIPGVYLRDNLAYQITEEELQRFIRYGGESEESYVDGYWDILVESYEFDSFDGVNDLHLLECKAGGFWSVDMWQLQKIEQLGELVISPVSELDGDLKESEEREPLTFQQRFDLEIARILSKRSLMLRPTYRTPGTGIAAWLRVTSPEISVITVGDLWLTKRDLGALYDSMKTNQPLPNIYNNNELAQRAREQVEAAQRDPSPRVTMKQSDMIRALVDLQFTQEGRCLDDMGHQEFFNQVLAKAFALRGIPCPTTAKTFDDWMKKSRKFSK